MGHILLSSEGHWFKPVSLVDWLFMLWIYLPEPIKTQTERHALDINLNYVMFMYVNTLLVDAFHELLDSCVDLELR